jgi:antirestriction protein ArdC
MTARNPLEPLMADIIARIEAGVPPWRQPWRCGGDPGVPLRADGQAFSGTNLWVLAFVGAARGYASPYWFTFKQALAIGACVRRGEKGTPALLYKTRVVGDDGADERPAATEDARVLRYLKGYTVFSAEQLENCPNEYLAAPRVNPSVRAATRDAVLDAIPAKVQIGGGVAAYIPSIDVIRMPPPEVFDTPDDYKATFAHEAVHWTSHPSRVDRKLGAQGTPEYAFEELVGELGSAILGLKIGLAPQLLDGHAAYLGHWVRILRERPNALLEASGHAQRAVDHLLTYSEAPNLAEAA